MDLNARLASFDAALLRLNGRMGKSATQRPALAEMREVLADLEALLTTHGAELPTDERRYLQQIRRTMNRKILGYRPRESLRGRLRRIWSTLEPKIRRAVAARRPN